MTKVRITASAMLDVIKKIFSDSDIDILDGEARAHFGADMLQEALNIEYYTFKYRPASTEQILQEIEESGLPVNILSGVERAFCCFTMASVERVFTKDIDQAVVEGVLDFWVQTGKLEMVEYLLDKVNRALTGVRIPVTFLPENETRKAYFVFDTLGDPELDLESQIGEAARISVGVLIALNPDVVSYSDYTVSISFEDENRETVSSVIPLNSISFASTMTQKSVPYVGNSRKVGNINLSGANSFVLVFDGHNNKFINYLMKKALGSDVTGENAGDNNESFMLTIKRGNDTFTHEVVIKDHQVNVSADTSNESHTLTLVTRGI